MAIIHSMNVKRFKSVGDLTKGYFKSLLACFHSFDCVVDVFDRYDVEQSVKSTERKRRYAGHIGRVFQIIYSRPIPPYRTRADGHHSFRILETPVKLYLVIVSHGGTCVMFQGVVTRKPNKTGFVFGNSKNSQGRIVIKSSDTDVFLFCLHYFPQMSNIEELWFQTGSVNSMKTSAIRSCA
jgi:hypothetical protein